eukprot:NODE_46_length_27655_cov_0.671796.p6 type:complete len:598 gc:universal NODE_46_length_27655_cov_0.671796:110-1903(+)
METNDLDKNSSMADRNLSTPSLRRSFFSRENLACPPDAPLFSQDLNDYELQTVIGYGSSAVVYQGLYKPLNRKVAVKEIDLDSFESNQIGELRRETQVMSLCRHPNVLRVFASFVSGSKLYIITPLLSGGSCLDIMRIAHPDGFEEVTVSTILRQVLMGLEYLHKNGNIHRDIKAGNVLIDDDGTVLLGDLGVTASLEVDRTSSRKTFVGTPSWMAPEVMKQEPYDFKADIWSFGILALELAKGEAPFAKYPPIKILMLIINNEPPFLDRDSTKHKYSKHFKEMIELCLQKDPNKRPTAEKLLHHHFFRQSKRKQYLINNLISLIPPVYQREHQQHPKPKHDNAQSDSWDFSDKNKLTSEKPNPVVEDEKLDKSEIDSSNPTSPTLNAQQPVKKSRFIVDRQDSLSAKSKEAAMSDVEEKKKGRFSVSEKVDDKQPKATRFEDSISRDRESLNREQISPNLTGKRGRFEVTNIPDTDFVSPTANNQQSTKLARNTSNGSLGNLTNTMNSMNRVKSEESIYIPIQKDTLDRLTIQLEALARQNEYQTRMLNFVMDKLSSTSPTESGLATPMLPRHSFVYLYTNIVRYEVSHKAACQAQ